MTKVLDLQSDTRRETRRDIEIERRRQWIESRVYNKLMDLRDVKILNHSIDAGEVIDAMHDLDPDSLFRAIGFAGTENEHWTPGMLAGLKRHAVYHVMNEYMGLIWRQAAKEVDSE